MLKKYMNLIIVFITLFSFCRINIYAYEFVNSDNENNVNDLISEIYDSKEQYEELVGEYEETIVEIREASSTSYWWPIGSEQTTEANGKVFATGDPLATNITSKYGYRDNPLGPGKQFHSGVDISGGNGVGTVNVIAARDGIVVYPTEAVRTDCPVSTSSSSCGGGYGNYVIIQHSDGNYTLYAHLHENTITVTAGESVQQGQVIGKMGSSGNSTGSHLHFEVREGTNNYSATVDPLNYISLENPRDVSTDNVFISWLTSWEGHTTIEGEYYIVEDLDDGVRTVGAGVTLENNPELFAKYGINIDDYPVGSKIPIKIVDQMKLEISGANRSYIEQVLVENAITLEEYQIHALMSRKYNYSISGFAEAYKKYGNTDDLYSNYMSRPITAQGVVLNGLIRRRESEWQLFHNGVYVFNDGTKISANESSNNQSSSNDSNNGTNLPSRYTYYAQCDNNWRSISLGTGGAYDTCSCGCGYTSFTMVAAALNKDSSITPKNVVPYLIQFSGSKCAISDNVLYSDQIRSKYGITPNLIFSRGSSLSAEEKKNKIVSELKSGKPVIVLIPGHYILLSTINSDGQIQVLDPGSSSRNGNFTIDEIYSKYYNYSNRCTSQGKCGFMFAISYSK